MLKEYHSNPETIEVGLDEAGRGSLIGPVCCAGVIWPTGLEHPLVKDIKDSKKLSAKKRKILKEFIISNCKYVVKFIERDVIDEMNILHATMKGFHNILDELEFNLVLVDGTYFDTHIKKNGEFSMVECVPKGDNHFLSIAAASILAKTFRDEYIYQLCDQFPILKEYDVHQNMGYGTKSHIEKIYEIGATEFHRKTFAPVKNLVSY